MKELRVLLAEDNPGDILLVREALQAHQIQHQLDIVRDGDEALALFARLGLKDGPPCPDILLLDMNLPKIDGPEILAAFRRNPGCGYVPVIVVTSSEAIRDKARMAALGIVHYFRKPSDLDEFMQLGAVVLETVAKSRASQSEAGG